jgi:hypothetical protein
MTAPALLPPAAAAEILGVHRATLDRLAELAPADLPGAPIQVGFGSTRRHYRYPADALLDWFRAASAAVNATAEPAPSPPRVTSAARRSASGPPSRSLRALVR